MSEWLAHNWGWIVLAVWLVGIIPVRTIGNLAGWDVWGLTIAVFWPLCLVGMIFILALDLIGILIDDASSWLADKVRGQGEDE